MTEAGQEAKLTRLVEVARSIWPVLNLRTQ
jgi:hypothetical protein